MDNITSTETALQYRNEKIINEFALAKKLCDIFDAEGNLSGPVKKISKVCVKLLQDLNKLIAENEEVASKLKAPCIKVYKGERFLTIMSGVMDALDDKTPGGDDKKFNDVKGEIDGWDGSSYNTKQAGEVVRLFAGICEAVNEKGTDETNLAKGLGLKIKDGSTELTDFGDFCGLRGAYRTTEWGEYAFSSGNRTREKNQNPKLDTSTQPYKGIAEALGLKNGAITGVSMNKLKAGSITLSIDKLMGLPEGADISGTTSDSIWCVETILNLLHNKKSINEVNDNVLLLPVAAIVSGYHHTILECGLSLSINGYLHYTPGFYTSLQNSKMKSDPSGNLIENALDTFTKKAENRIMFFYDNSSKTVVASTSEEKMAAESKITMNKDVYTQFGDKKTHNYSLEEAQAFLTF